MHRRKGGENLPGWVDRTGEDQAEPYELRQDCGRMRRELARHWRSKPDLGWAGCEGRPSERRLGESRDELSCVACRLEGDGIICLLCHPLAVKANANLFSSSPPVSSSSPPNRTNVGLATPPSPFPKSPSPRLPSQYWPQVKTSPRTVKAAKCQSPAKIVIHDSQLPLRSQSA
jgi:hypothetical protein